MRSGSQTFSRNQYAPIYGEREATALNPGTQPAVERSKSNRKWTRIEDSLSPPIVYSAHRPADLTRTANAASNSVFVIDAGTNAVTATVPVGVLPVDAAVF